MSSKAKIRGVISRLSEYIPEQAVQKEMLQSFNKINDRGGICILKIASIYSFTGTLKAHVLLFQKINQV